VDSDKATLELPAEEAGVITLKAEEGDTVAVGQVVCLIDTSAVRPEGATKSDVKKEVVAEVASPVAEKTTPNPMPSAEDKKEKSYAEGTASPAASKIMAENNVKASQIKGTGKDGRITKQDVV